MVMAEYANDLDKYMALPAERPSHAKYLSLAHTSAHMAAHTHEAFYV